jgi:hypothetical protein
LVFFCYCFSLILVPNVKQRKHAKKDEAKKTRLLDLIECGYIKAGSQVNYENAVGKISKRGYIKYEGKKYSSPVAWIRCLLQGEFAFSEPYDGWKHITCNRVILSHYLHKYLEDRFHVVTENC